VLALGGAPADAVLETLQAVDLRLDDGAALDASCPRRLRSDGGALIPTTRPTPQVRIGDDFEWAPNPGFGDPLAPLAPEPPAGAGPAPEPEAEAAAALGGRRAGAELGIEPCAGTAAEEAAVEPCWAFEDSPNAEWDGERRVLACRGSMHGSTLTMTVLRRARGAVSLEEDGAGTRYS
jgi:hypothetical protein